MAVKDEGDLDELDPHGHGLDMDEKYRVEDGVAYRIEQAYLRGFAQGLSCIRQHWDRAHPRSALEAEGEVSSSEEWAMQQRFKHQREPKRRIYMCDALWARLSLLRKRR